MMAYPDGLDEVSAVREKHAAPSSSKEYHGGFDSRMSQLSADPAAR
jgi:hypothetical protein